MAGLLRFTEKKTLHFYGAIIGFGATLVLLGVMVFGWVAVSRFLDTENLWLNYNQKATAIDNALARLNMHIGYGGFIHNFKNYVLRRDEKYVARIDRNLIGISEEMARLDKLLGKPEDRLALAQIRATFEEYAGKYQLAKPLVAEGKTSQEIDQVVKVDDTAALKAMAFLVERATARSREAELASSSALNSAIFFLETGGFALVLLIAAVAVAMLFFVRRIVAANEVIRKIREELDTLLDKSPDAMLCVARDGRITRSNDMAQRFFGYSAEAFLNMKIEELIPSHFREKHAELRAGYFLDPHHRAMGQNRRLTALTRYGAEPQVEISLSHSGEGETAVATITVRDVTERERDRAALAQAKREAEQTLEELRNTQESLIQSEKMAALGGLVAGVAHEINTPIGITLSSSTYLDAETAKISSRYHAGELSGDELESYFDTARQSARLMTVNSQRAAELVHSFKQVAVDQSGGERRDFDLKTYIEEILLSLQPKLKKTPVRVELDCPAGMIVDSFPGALSQCLTNFIVNSLTHAFDPQQAGHIAIRASLMEDDRVELVYADDGKGIPPEHQSKVFEPFFTTRRGKGGSGLGLHIVYNIVHQTLKGDLKMASEPGLGVIFTITFPRILPNL